MQESTLNNEEAVQDLINSSVEILSNTPYTIIHTHLCNRILPVICVEREHLLYPLFILPTTETIASVIDDSGDPVFRLKKAN